MRKLPLKKFQLKSGTKKRAHVQKLAISKKFAFFVQSHEVIIHTDFEVLVVEKKVPAMRLYSPSNLLISGLKFIEKQIF